MLIKKYPKSLPIALVLLLTRLVTYPAEGFSTNWSREFLDQLSKNSEIKIDTNKISNEIVGRTIVIHITCGYGKNNNSFWLRASRINQKDIAASNYLKEDGRTEEVFGKTFQIKSGVHVIDFDPMSSNDRSKQELKRQMRERLIINDKISFSQEDGMIIKINKKNDEIIFNDFGKIKFIRHF